MVAPSWLKARFTSAASSADGASQRAVRRTAVPPFNCAAHQSAAQSETARQRGCRKNMEKVSTSTKYRRFTAGWQARKA